MLLLDVSGAYDNTAHRRLIHNLRKLGLTHAAVWVEAFLQRRSTCIRLPRYLSEEFSTPTGIPQGSPISPILYLVYNYPLINPCVRVSPDGAKTTTYGWVDDVASFSFNKSIIFGQEANPRSCGWGTLRQCGHMGRTVGPCVFHSR
jgi:Reverse transcriptase (RNA-dependent DNA polymerase)